jgi:hypothetical protein
MKCRIFALVHKNAAFWNLAFCSQPLLQASNKQAENICWPSQTRNSVIEMKFYNKKS